MNTSSKKTPPQDDPTTDLAYPDAFVRQISDLEASIKRYSKTLNELKKKKAIAYDRLYKWMEKKGLEEYRGVPLKKVEPKVRKPRVTKKYKRSETLKLFSQIGIQDPEDIYNRIEGIQRGGMGASGSHEGGS